MSDGPLLNDVTRAFAEAHRNEDVRDLALKTFEQADLEIHVRQFLYERLSKIAGVNYGG